MASELPCASNNENCPAPAEVGFFTVCCTDDDTADVFSEGEDCSSAENVFKKLSVHRLNSNS